LQERGDGSILYLSLEILSTYSEN